MPNQDGTELALTPSSMRDSQSGLTAIRSVHACDGHSTIEQARDDGFIQFHFQSSLVQILVEDRIEIGHFRPLLRPAGSS